MQNNIYKPYYKANHKPTYTNKNSNHPPNFLKQLKKSIGNRLSETLSSKYLFDKSLKLYNDALKDSSFSNGLCYIENNNNPNNNNNNNNKKRKRKRKRICSIFLFSKSLNINIGKIFLQLLLKLFPKHRSKIYKTFKRNTVKTSYSCMKNIGSIISVHDQNIWNPTVKFYGCRCRVKNSYPFNSKTAGGVDITTLPRCGFSKKLSSNERVKPWVLSREEVEWRFERH